MLHLAAPPRPAHQRAGCRTGVPWWETGRARSDNERSVCAAQVERVVALACSHLLIKDDQRRAETLPDLLERAVPCLLYTSPSPRDAHES
eukprot:4455275-Prymnesium_polylepis.1